MTSDSSSDPLIQPASAATTSVVVPLKSTRRRVVPRDGMDACRAPLDRGSRGSSHRRPSPGGSRCSRCSSRSARARSSPAARCSSPRSSGCPPGRSASASPSPGSSRSSSRCRSASSPTASAPSGCGRSARASAAALFAVWPLIDGFGAYLAMMVALAAGRDRRLVRPRRLHDRRLPARGAGAVAGLHAVRPQHRLHRRRPHRRPGPGLRQRRPDPGRAAVHRGDAGLNTLYITRLPDAEHDVRPPRPREKLGRGALRNRGFLLLNFMRRRARHQPGAAQHGDPALAGAGDRRSAGAAGLAVRHQHGACARAAPGAGGPRRRRRQQLAAGVAAQHDLLRALLPRSRWSPTTRSAG